MTRQTQFEFTYDADADILGIWLPAPSRNASTQEIAPGVHIDLTPKGHLVSVELLDASSRYPLAMLRALASPAIWMTLVQAARESGLAPDTLRRQVLAGRLEARKQGRDWLVSSAALWTYLESRAPSGRPPATRKGRRLRRQTGKRGG